MASLFELKVIPEKKVQKDTKVKRYWPGKKPDYAGEEDDEEYMDEEPEVCPAPSHTEKPSVAVELPAEDVDDPRLRRLRRDTKKDSSEEESDDDELARRRRRRRNVEEAAVILEEPEEVTPAAPAEIVPEVEKEEAGIVGEEEEDVTDRRARLKARLLKQTEEEQEALPVASEDESGGESDEEESEYETDTSESDDERTMLKPVFVKKKERETIKEIEAKEKEEKTRESERKARFEVRKKETCNMLSEQIKMEEAAAKQAMLNDDDTNMPDDSDDINEAEEYEAWKQRELARIKLERDERERHRQELADRARRNDMTEEERLAVLRQRENMRRANNPQKKMRFLQKWFHKGAFFMDTDDTGVLKEEIYRRDYSSATMDDMKDKSMLPRVMQVKNFGRSGGTKWTHLVDQDTTDRDALWGDPSAGHANWMGGVREAPVHLKRKRE
eukprot:Rmarinus@m.21026